MATSHMADQVGRVLGERYRLVAPIGTGGSAHVFAADDVKLRRRVAVKILHPALARDESFLRRFRAEAQAVATLRHPNIMTVFDWGEDDDGPYLVLEHLAGGSLRDLLDNGHRLSPAQARVVGLEAARGLEYAHRKGVVHRDVKPANLLFDEDGRLGIADFGLARALAGAAVTEPGGALLGTIRYFAPEQAQGRSVDGRSDVYALALVLVEAVTGQPPPVGDNISATLAARVDRSIDVPAALGPLAPALAAAGAADQDHRLDAAGLVRALEAVGEDLPPPEPLPVAAATVAGSPPSPADLTQLPLARPRLFDVEAEQVDDVDRFPPARRRSRRALLVALGLLLAALAVAGGGYAIVAARVPTHPVPRVVALTVDAARAEVADEQFRVVVAAQRFDEEVELDRIITQDQAPGKSPKEGRAVRVVVSRGPQPREVPVLANLTRAAAEAALIEARFTPVFRTEYHETIEKDVVITWSPREGSQPRGSEVTVTVSDGKKPVKVPSLADKVFEEARKVLEGLGLVAHPEESFSDDVAKGIVISTRPPTGDEAPFGSEVVVKVSKGPDLVAVPSVIGKEFEEAKAVLEAAGLRVDGPFPPRKGRVFLTDPAQGSSVRRGTTVNVFVK